MLKRACKPATQLSFGVSCQKMKAIPKYIIGITVPLGALGVFMYIFVGRGLDMDCGNQIVSEQQSPDNRMKIVLFQRDCGATTPFTTQISLLPIHERLRDESGNIFVADADHGKAPRGEWDGPDVKVRWQSNKTIQIEHDVLVRVFKSVEKHQGIEIQYEKTANKAL